MPQIQLWPATRNDAQHIVNTTPAETLDLHPCSVCGNLFHAPKSGNGRRRSFCSKHCYIRHAEKNPGRARWVKSEKGKAVARRKVAKFQQSDRYKQYQRWATFIRMVDPSQRPQPKPNLNPWPTCTTVGCHNMPTKRGIARCRTCARETRLQKKWRNAGKPCVICGKPLSRYQQKTCSESCEHQRDLVCPKRRASRRNIKARRRARKRNAYVEDVDVLIHLQWQAGRCYHCQCKIRLDVESPHPKSLTLDHLVPFALGGEHSYANTVASCFNCNCAIKGDRAINEQLKCV